VREEDQIKHCCNPTEKDLTAIEMRNRYRVKEGDSIKKAVDELWTWLRSLEYANKSTKKAVLSQKNRSMPL